MELHGHTANCHAVPGTVVHNTAGTPETSRGIVTRKAHTSPRRPAPPLEPAQASYLQLLDTVHHLRATAGPVDLELLLPEDLFAGCELLYGLPVRRVPGVIPGVVARLPDAIHTRSA